jgi:hypothetical protein
VRVWVVATANLAALVAEDREETARATRARETGRALFDRPVRAHSIAIVVCGGRVCVLLICVVCGGRRGAGAATGAAWRRSLPRWGQGQGQGCRRKHRRRGPRS